MTDPRVWLQQRRKGQKKKQNVKMEDADKEGWDVDEESSVKEVSTSWRRSESQDGGLPIYGALGEVVEAAHCEVRSWLNREWRNRTVKTIKMQECSWHE